MSKDKRRQASITRVSEALEDMRARGEKAYTPAHVERALHRLGYAGRPSAQSIYNERRDAKSAGTGKPTLADLIDEYNSAYGEAPAAYASDDDQALAAAIPDLRVRTMVLSMRAEIRSLKASETRLRQEWATRTLLAPDSPAATHATPPRGAPFTTAMTKAVAHFLNRLARYGWEEDEGSGALLDRATGEEIAMPGFIHALRLVVEAKGS